MTWKTTVYGAYGQGTSLWFTDNGSATSTGGQLQHTVLWLVGASTQFTTNGVTADFPSQELIHGYSYNHVDWWGQFNNLNMTLLWN
jgi:hypothetical protein